ncbi:ATP-binding protein [Streptomyces sp. NBC_00078]|uniref:ATP-binding protein n=1 Tax=unclassified Streptomyces TaxID=2593676 RepID=UPI00224D2E3D|nr:ATP-binding protein [Streptomyces sp. NBC_00078]MCX5419938.1 ATP-binding protein [Streptomyces sp. NBC_00078]
MTTTARPTGRPGYSETMPRKPESAATARNLVRVAFGVWGLDDLADDGALIVSELVGNAVRHARASVIRVTVTQPAPGLVRIGVVDRSQVFPTLRNPDDEDEDDDDAAGGRGLWLVDAMTHRWGTDALPWGKRVWAELRETERG